MFKFLLCCVTDSTSYLHGFLFGPWHFILAILEQEFQNQLTQFIPAKFWKWMRIP